MIHSLERTNKRLTIKFLFLYLLNCLDIMFTFTFLKTGHFYEANPLMQPIVTNLYLCLFIKVLLPGAILFILCEAIHASKTSLGALYQIPSTCMLILYLFINSMHIYYLINLLNF